MAEYYRNELRMLKARLSDLRASLTGANTKHEALLIKDSISVCKAEIRLCERDLRKEIANA